MVGVIVFAEEDSWAKQLSSAAREFGEPVLITVGADRASGVKEYFKKIYVIDSDLFDPEAFASSIGEVVDKESAKMVLFPCTNKGRMLAGLLAGQKGFNTATDVMNVEKSGDKITVTKLTFGGNASAKITFTEPIIVCVVSGAYKEAEPLGAEASIENLTLGTSRLKISFQPRKLEGVDPAKADVVIGAGRGVKKKEDLEMIKELADILGGAWSVTRPLAADYGWADSWIGISGLIISPKLYIAVGISGQPHHTMGVRGSKIIVAINTDESAPIFEETDYGVIGDLYQVLPVLISKLKEKKK